MGQGARRLQPLQSERLCIPEISRHNRVSECHTQLPRASHANLTNPGIAFCQVFCTLFRVSAMKSLQIGNGRQPAPPENHPLSHITRRPLYPTQHFDTASPETPRSSSPPCLAALPTRAFASSPWFSIARLQPSCLRHDHVRFRQAVTTTLHPHIECHVGQANSWHTYPSSTLWLRPYAVIERRGLPSFNV